MEDVKERAFQLAWRAHNGQFDKAGFFYLSHVARVVNAVSGDDLAEAVAWLHDVLEDCPNFVEELLTFPAEVTDGLAG